MGANLIALNSVKIKTNEGKNLDLNIDIIKILIYMKILL